MLLAGLLALALGVAIWRKSRQKLATGEPYVFGFWDGGMLLSGEEWQPRHTIWIGRSLVAVAALAAAGPAVLAGMEWRREQVRKTGGPCEHVLTESELHSAGFPQGAVVWRSYLPKSSCNIHYPDYFSVDMDWRPRSAPAILAPVPGVADAATYTLHRYRHLVVRRGATLNVTVPESFPEEALYRLAAIAASRTALFEAL